MDPTATTASSVCCCTICSAEIITKLQLCELYPCECKVCLPCVVDRLMDIEGEPFSCTECDKLVTFYTTYRSPPPDEEEDSDEEEEEDSDDEEEEEEEDNDSNNNSEDGEASYKHENGNEAMLIPTKRPVPSAARDMHAPFWWQEFIHTRLHGPHDTVLNIDGPMNVMEIDYLLQSIDTLPGGFWAPKCIVFQGFHCENHDTLLLLEHFLQKSLTKQLNFDRCPFTETFVDFLRGLHQVSFIKNLIFFNYDAEALPQILGALRECNHLEKFEFAEHEDNFETDEIDIALLPRFITQNQALTHFELESTSELLNHVPELIDSIVANTRWEKVQLPFAAVNALEVSRLLSHAVLMESTGIFLDLSIVDLYETDSDEGFSLAIKKFGWGQETMFEDFTRGLGPIADKISQISTQGVFVATDIFVSTLTEVFFNNPASNVSELHITSEPLQPQDFELLCRGSMSYEKLKNLHLCIKGNPDQVTELFPNCELEGLDLAFSGTSSSAAFGASSRMLRTHTSLESLEFQPDTDVYGDETAVSSFLEFLRDHPKLRELKIGRAGEGFSEFLVLLSRIVLEQDSSLEALVLPHDNVDVEALVKIIPSMKRIRQLWFPFELFDISNNLFPALKQNTTITRFYPNDLLTQHEGFNQVLLRNRHLLRAQTLADGESRHEIHLWAPALRKLGSIENEPSPIYFFLRRCTETLISIIPKKHISPPEPRNTKRTRRTRKR